MTYGDLFDGVVANNKFPTTRGMTDAAVHARQLESRRVTRKTAVCLDVCCTSGPRRPDHMLVNAGA